MSSDFDSSDLEALQFIELLSDSSSGDEEARQYQRIDHFTLNSQDLQFRFRLDKPSVQSLLEEIYPYTRVKSAKNHGLPPLHQLLSAVNVRIAANSRKLTQAKRYDPFPCLPFAGVCDRLACVETEQKYTHGTPRTTVADLHYTLRLVESCSISVLQALRNNITTSGLLLECHNLLTTVCSQNQVTLQWIKGHSNSRGNDAADELARKATEIVVLGPQPIIPLRYD